MRLLNHASLAASKLLHNQRYLKKERIERLESEKANHTANTSMKCKPHLKSPSHFSCFMTNFTMGDMTIRLITVPTRKKPQMLTGPSHPVLLKRENNIDLVLDIVLIRDYLVCQLLQNLLVFYISQEVYFICGKNNEDLAMHKMQDLNIP